jgi:hypothetical protein
LTGNGAKLVYIQCLAIRWFSSVFDRLQASFGLILDQKLCFLLVGIYMYVSFNADCSKFGLKQAGIGFEPKNLCAFPTFRFFLRVLKIKSRLFLI